jgi:hypothetical protein
LKLKKKKKTEKKRKKKKEKFLFLSLLSSNNYFTLFLLSAVLFTQIVYNKISVWNNLKRKRNKHIPNTVTEG